MINTRIRTNYTIHNNGLDLYLAEIRKAKALTREDEVAIFDRVYDGDEKAKTEIFNRTAKFAVAVAKTYTDNPVMLQDLIQEANIGILDAIDKYDSSKGFRFISFAVYYMKLHVSNFIGNSELVHSTSSHKLKWKVKKIREKYLQEHDYEPSEYEILDALEDMGEVIKDIRYLHSVCVSSIDQAVGNDDDCETFAEVGEFADSTSTQNGYLDIIDQDDINTKVSDKMSRLTDREKLIVALKFGLGDNSPMEYRDIANKLSSDGPKKICTERVRQICKEALAKMK